MTSRIKTIALYNAGQDGHLSLRGSIEHHSPKRVHLPNAVYFVTTKTKGNAPFFANRKCCEYLEGVLQLVQEMKKCRIIAYVVVPDHVHLLIQPQDKYTILDIMHFIKRHSTRNIRIMANQLSSVAEDGHLRLRNFSWQHSFHDHIIRNDNDLNAHIEYIRYNPEKHGVAEAGEVYPYLFIGDTV